MLNFILDKQLTQNNWFNLDKARSKTSKTYKFCKKESDKDLFDIFSEYQFTDSCLSGWEIDTSHKPGVFDFVKFLYEIYDL